MVHLQRYSFDGLVMTVLTSPKFDDSPSLAHADAFVSKLP